MKKIAVVLLSFALMSSSASPDIVQWLNEKIEDPATFKKVLDVVALSTDLATTKDTRIIGDGEVTTAIIGCIKLLANWIDLQKLEKHYLPYYLKEQLLKYRWYQDKKREQYRNKQKAPNILDLLLF